LEAAHKGPKHLKVERVKRKRKNTKSKIESITDFSLFTCKGTIGAQYKKGGFDPSRVVVFWKQVQQSKL